MVHLDRVLILSFSHLPMSPAFDFLERTHSDTIVLFDVDGTLTPARQVGYWRWYNCCMPHQAQMCIGF